MISESIYDQLYRPMRPTRSIYPPLTAPYPCRIRRTKYICLPPTRPFAPPSASCPVFLVRFSSDRKTRARQAMISICADSPQEAASVSSQATTDEPAMFVLEVDSPFFQLGRDSVLLASEPLGAGGGGGDAGVGTAAGTAGNTADRNTSGGVKNRNLPKKFELLDPTSRGSHGQGGAGDPRGPTVAGAAGGGASGGDLSTLPATNAAVLSFFPRAAGTYPCRVLVKRRTKYLVDIRCVDLAGAVEAPRNATALVFRAPAGQKITQEVGMQIQSASSAEGLRGSASYCSSFQDDGGFRDRATGCAVVALFFIGNSFCSLVLFGRSPSTKGRL